MDPLWKITTVPTPLLNTHVERYIANSHLWSNLLTTAPDWVVKNAQQELTTTNVADGRIALWKCETSAAWGIATSWGMDRQRKWGVPLAAHVSAYLFQGIQSLKLENLKPAKGGGGCYLGAKYDSAVYPTRSDLPIIYSSGYDPALLGFYRALTEMLAQILEIPWNETESLDC